MAETKLLVLIGTKAQFIKTAPVLRELDIRGIPYRLVYTGQHSETFDMLEAAFGTRAPDEVLVPGFEAATHLSFASWTWRYWKSVLRRVRSPEWRGCSIGLVHGDTASTLFSAIALRLAGVKVGHIEAGLRSSRLLEPFPEEIVRRLVSRVSSVHFVPGMTAERNLEGVRGHVVNTQGNTLKDALLMALERGADKREGAKEGAYAIFSVHRSENLSNRPVFDMLMEVVVETASTIPVRFVLHPATRERIRVTGWLPRLQAVDGLQMLERMDYPDFVKLLVGSRFLMTDGGSNQEEAAMLGLPTLLLRRTTEREDGLDATVELSRLQRDTIREFVARRAATEWQVGRPTIDSPSSVLVQALEPLLESDDNGR